MDPIHPILPQPLNIPPVVKPPEVGRIDRDGRREGDRNASKRGKQRRPAEHDGTPGHSVRSDSDEDDGRPRIDITA